MSLKYNVVDVVTQEIAFGPFDTAKEAAERARMAKEILGRSFRVVSVKNEDLVAQAKAREEARFANGDYKPLPDWFLEYCKPEHYAHWATSRTKAEQGWIAYTADEQALVADRQTAVLASRYLSKHTDLPSEKISELFQRLISAGGNYEFKITTNREEVRDAYIGRDHCAESSDYPSCMRYNSADYELDSEHPCDAYVGGNSTFALAYLIDADNNNDIVARAVVGTRNKGFVRVYGYTEAHRVAIISQLEAAGYRRISGFAGEQLNLIEHPNMTDHVIVPYMDGKDVTCSVEGEICFGQEGDIQIDVTDGCARRPEKHYCVDCGGLFADRRLTHFNSGFHCVDCTDQLYFYCPLTDAHFSKATTNSLEVVMWPRERAHVCADTPEVRAKIFWCEYAKVWHYEIGFMKVEVRTSQGTQTWNEQAARVHARVVAGVYEARADFPAPSDRLIARSLQVGDIVQLSNHPTYGGHFAVVTHVHGGGEYHVTLETGESLYAGVAGLTFVERGDTENPATPTIQVGDVVRLVRRSGFPWFNDHVEGELGTVFEIRTSDNNPRPYRVVYNSAALQNRYRGYYAPAELLAVIRRAS